MTPRQTEYDMVSARPQMATIFAMGYRHPRESEGLEPALG